VLLHQQKPLSGPQIEVEGAFHKHGHKFFSLQGILHLQLLRRPLLISLGYRNKAGKGPHPGAASDYISPGAANASAAATTWSVWCTAFPFWAKTLLEPTPLGCIVPPDCFLSTPGRLIIHFVVRPLPAFLANQNHEGIHDDGHCHADQYFFHVGSISSAHSPGAVTLGTLAFQPTIPLAERAAVGVLLRLSLTSRT